MSNLNLKNRTIFNRDNLDILKGINSNSIDLIYLDPPFNKKKIFTAPIGSSAEGADFSDIFSKEDIKDDWVSNIYFQNINLFTFLQHTKYDGMTYNYCYLVYMAVRLIECHRILKDTGSIYLHCDPTMSHYLKIVMDCIFGEKCFKNEIIWCYSIGGKSKSQWGKKHDVILFYTKSRKFVFNGKSVSIPRKPNTHMKAGRDLDGREYQEKIDNKSGKVYRYYLDEGKIPEDYWTDINTLQKDDKQRTGYPTQKPLALLERIIKGSSNKGDMVLDPFCGCATTCVAAENLDRQWAGIDISYKAYELVKERLNREVPNLLWDVDEEITFTSKVPIRDVSIKHIDKGYVYVISNKAYKGFYKVGIAKDIQKRLKAFQTYDPKRRYKLERQFKCSNYIEVEKLTHEKFDFGREHEWVVADLNEIIEFIDSQIVL